MTVTAASQATHYDTHAIRTMLRAGLIDGELINGNWHVTDAGVRQLRAKRELNPRKVRRSNGGWHVEKPQSCDRDGYLAELLGQHYDPGYHRQEHHAQSALSGGSSYPVRGRIRA